MTFEEVSIACKGYELRRARMVDVDRLIATILLNVYRGEGAPAYLPEDVYPLITDTKKRLITKEEYQEFNEVMDSVKWQSN